MFEFREHGGMLWEIRPLESPDELFGASIAYGLFDEPVAEHGALQIAAEHLRRELSRPLELPDGVYVPSIDVEAHPALLAIRVRGRRDAIEAVQRRWHAVFEQATVDPATPMAPLPPLATPGWQADLAVRAPGTGPLLSALGAPAPGAAARAETLLRELSPRARRHRCLLTVSDPSLMSVIDWPPAPAAPRPDAPPTPFAERPGNGFGAVHSPLDDLLWTQLLPRTPDGFAALQVVRGAAEREITAIAPRGRDGRPTVVQISTLTLARDLLVRVATDAPLTIPQRRQLVERLVTAPMPYADPLLRDAVAAAEQTDLHGFARLDRLFGAPPAPAPSIAGVRAALAQASRTTHLKLPRIAPVLGGDPAAATSDLPFLVAPIDAIPRQRFGSVLPKQRLRTIGEHVGVLGLDGAKLVDATPRAFGDPAARAGREGVDLDRLIAVYTSNADGGAETSPTGRPDILMLVDDRLRHLTIVPALFARRGRLERLLEERTAGAPRIHSPGLAPSAAALTAIARKQRRTSAVLYGVAAVMVGGVLALAIGQAIEERSRPTEPVRHETGTAVELDHGTTVTVESIEREPEGAPDGVNVATVEYCAGEGGHGGALGTEEWFEPANFRMWRGAVELDRMIAGLEREVDPHRMWANTCEVGTIAYLDGGDGELYVVFENADGHMARWNAPPGE